MKLEEKPTAKNFQKHGVRAMLQWHTAPLERIIKGASGSPIVVMTAINIFLEWCSKEDWRMRLDWLKSRLLPSTKEGSRSGNQLETARQYFERLFDTDAVKRFYNIFENVKIDGGGKLDRWKKLHVLSHLKKHFSSRQFRVIWEISLKI